MDIFNKTLVGLSPDFQAVLDAARMVAVTDVSLLILGESGTGKEMLARAAHGVSRRHGAPFISINCAALPETLVESELFGHRKGAFTGADRSYGGRVRAAAGGTLFLDEIGELPLAIQAKLLRFLETRECQGVGESTPEVVDVRIIAATHRDLYALCQQGRFREDLYYRLNVVPLVLPPLRCRRADILPLAAHFMAQLAAQYHLPAPRFQRDALGILKGHDWPGNVRELRNLCERLLVLFPGREIGVENLPVEMRRARAAPWVQGLFTLPEGGVRLDELERDMITQALAKSQGNRSRAARLLGLSRDTLLYRLKKYAIG